MAAIASVRYTHDAIIDKILLDPAISQNALARMFGFTATWVSIMVNSDAFKNRLAERKAELSDPVLVATINERLDAVAKRSLDKLIERLDRPGDALATRDLIGIAKLGVGDKNTRPAGPVVQTNLYVLSIPAPAQNSKEWLSNVSSPKNNPPGLPLVEEVPTGG